MFGHDGMDDELPSQIILAASSDIMSLSTNDDSLTTDEKWIKLHCIATRDFKDLRLASSHEDAIDEDEANYAMLICR